MTGEPKEKRTTKARQVVKWLLLAVSLAVVIYGAYVGLNSRGTLDYAEHIDDVAATVDGEDITLSDLAFYVVYEERVVEEDAAVYNPDNTRDFWNTNLNGAFVYARAKKAVLGMAVHDNIFYRAALEEGLTLTDEEETYLENSKQDFWMDLLDVQRDRLPVDEDVLNETMEKIALAEKYQRQIAQENKRYFVEYSWDGYDYEQLLKNEHKVKTNRRLWRRVQLGNITLVHTKTNYINGQTDEERENYRKELDENPPMMRRWNTIKDFFKNGNEDNEK